MSTRYATKGGIVKHGASATPTTNLAGVRNIAIAGGDRQLIDASCHDSTGTKEYILSPLRDTMDLTITVAWDPADTGHEAIRAAFAANTKYYLTVVFPDGGNAQYAFEGYFTNVQPQALNPTDGIMESVFSFKATAAETYTQ